MAKKSITIIAIIYLAHTTVWQPINCFNMELIPRTSS